MRYLIVVDKRNPLAVNALRVFQKECRKVGIRCFSSPRGVFSFDYGNEPDLIVVFGGDGTMLRAIQKHWRFFAPFLGVSYGKIGALGNDPEGLSVAALREKTYDVKRLPLLRFRAMRKNADVIGGIAANDVAFDRDANYGGSAHLRVFVDDHLLYPDLSGNGFLISTPLGSTGYSHSITHCGIVDFLHESLVTTAIDADTPYPLIIHPPQARIRVEVLRTKEQPVNMAYDGMVCAGIQSAEVRLLSRFLKLAFVNPRSFPEHFHRIVRKQLQKIIEEAP